VIVPNHIAQAVADLEHERNLRGVTSVMCPACRGIGGRDEDEDEDAHYWGNADPCRTCLDRGRVEIPCAPDVQIGAIEEEISRLKSKARALRKARK
jgi:hypothetical protein